MRLAIKLPTPTNNQRGATRNRTNANNQDDQEVDALAGATITGDGLSAMLQKDVKLYVPYFKSLNN